YRIGFFNLVTELGGFDVELVLRAFAHARNKAFPDSRRAAGLQLMRRSVPAIKVADHRHVPRVRSPDAEDRAPRTTRIYHVRAHFFVNAIVAALVEQMKIFGGQQRNIVANWG